MVAADHPAPGYVALRLAPNHAWAGHRAGQHVEVGVQIGSVEHRRTFSIASEPGRADGTIELLVSARHGGRVSSHLHEIRPGAVFRLSQAAGSFTLPGRGERPGHLLLVSGGSGLSPVLAMLRTLAVERWPGPVTVAHAAQCPEAVPHLDEVVALVDRLHHGRFVLTCSEAPDAPRMGPEHLASLVGGRGGTEVWLCGPERLAVPTRAAVAAAGLPLHEERFGLAPIDVPPGSDAVVTFARSGLAVPAAGTLLATAEAAGLTPRTGCRRGICGTCTTPKAAGLVRDAVTGRVGAPDAGPVRLCTGIPEGPVTLDL